MDSLIIGYRDTDSVELRKGSRSTNFSLPAVNLAATNLYKITQLIKVSATFKIVEVSSNDV